MKKLGSVVLAAGLFFTGCSDNESSPTATPPLTITPSPTASVTVTTPSPTFTATSTTAPTATPTAEPNACPLQDRVCERITEIQGWMETEDIEAIVESTQTNEYECPDPDDEQGEGGPYQLCEGAQAGEVRTGVALARRYSEGFVHSIASYGAMIQEYIDASDPGTADDLGSGAMRLIAVSCADAGESPSECSKSVAIFSGIVSGFEGGTRRELLLFWLPTEDIETSTPIEMVWTGSIPDPDVEILRVGGTLPDLGNVFPLTD